MAHVGIIALNARDPHRYTMEHDIALILERIISKYQSRNPDRSDFTINPDWQHAGYHHQSQY